MPIPTLSAVCSGYSPSFALVETHTLVRISRKQAKTSTTKEDFNDLREEGYAVGFRPSEPGF